MQRGLLWPPVDEKHLETKKEFEAFSKIKNDDEGIDMEDETEQAEAEASPIDRLEYVKSGIEAEDIEMGCADSGVSDCQLNDGDVEMVDAKSTCSAPGWNDGADEDTPQDPKPAVSDESDSNESAVWMEVRDFINKMNGTLAVARERILCADDAILEARDALPGFLEGHLKYY